MSDYIKGCSLAIAFYYSYPEHFCDDNYENTLSEWLPFAFFLAFLFLLSIAIALNSC